MKTATHRAKIWAAPALSSASKFEWLTNQDADGAKAQAQRKKSSPPKRGKLEVWIKEAPNGTLRPPFKALLPRSVWSRLIIVQDPLGDDYFRTKDFPTNPDDQPARFQDGAWNTYLRAIGTYVFRVRKKNKKVSGIGQRTAPSPVIMALVFGVTFLDIAPGLAATPACSVPIRNFGSARESGQQNKDQRNGTEQPPLQTAAFAASASFFCAKAQSAGG